ncbi:MAG: ferrous iron transport protein A [Leptotrichiaceae bacterium]|nr:ferrous iron transport protein A [Leptotrichiaceae bacterium]
MITLKESEVDKNYIVKKISGSGSFKRRIMDMGITKNTELYVRKVAPLGDPVQISLRGYELSLRKEDAECVEIELVSL